MNIDNAERAHERADIEDYSALLDLESASFDAEAKALLDFMDDAYTGRDPDWVGHDSERNADTLLQIAAILRTDDEPADKVSDIRSLIYALQCAAGEDHVAALKRNGVL